MAGVGQGELVRRQRIAHGLARFHSLRRKREAVLPQHLRQIRRGHVPAHLRPLLTAAETDLVELLGSLGADRISPQRRMLCEEAAGLRLLIAAERVRYVQTADGEIASRLGTLVGQLRSTLLAIGLDQIRVEHDLATYLAGKTTGEAASQAAQDRAGDAIDAKPANGIDQPSDRAQHEEEASS